MKDNTLSIGETGPSKRSRHDEEWDPQFIDGRFVCIVECASCNGDLGMSGNSEHHVEYFTDENGEPDSYLATTYFPKQFTDAPPAFVIPENTPESVVEQIVRSFHLFWSDESACANSIRSSVEELLTCQRVNRSAGRPPAGKRRRMLSLHARIALFAQRNGDIAEKLSAIKWIGNAGSHFDMVRKDDLLDAYDILSFVLEDLYIQRRAKVDALARSINKRKAPRTPRKGP